MVWRMDEYLPEIPAQLRSLPCGRCASGTTGRMEPTTSSSCTPLMSIARRSYSETSTTSVSNRARASSVPTSRSYGRCILKRSGPFGSSGRLLRNPRHRFGLHRPPSRFYTVDRVCRASRLVLLAAIVIGGLVVGVIVLVHLYNVVFGDDSISWKLLLIMAGYGIVINGLIGSALMAARAALRGEL